jgi:hypothetical protein
VPSRFRPVRSRTTLPWRGVPAISSSVYVMTIRTGCPVRRANWYATGASIGEPLPPKSPPMCAGLQRTQVSGMSSALASCSRNRNGLLLDIQKSGRPLASMDTSTEYGSR